MRGPIPTADPEIVRQLLANPDLGFQAIADRVGVSRERIRQIAKRFGVTGRQCKVSRRNTRFMAETKVREAEEAAIFDHWQKTGQCDGIRAAMVINRSLVVVGMKRCCRCNQPKRIAEMSLQKSTRCKSCTAKNTAEWRARFKERDLDAYRLYRARHNRQWTDNKRKDRGR